MNAVLMLLLAADPTGVADSDVLLLDFTAGYCPPCQEMVPLLQRMEHDGFPIRRIDITEEHEISREYHVERIPTLVLLVKGREVKRFVGLTAESELRREMNNAARALQPARTAAVADPPAATIPDSTKSAPPTESKKSFTDRLAGLFGRGKDNQKSLTIRGQDPESTSEPAEALVKAFAGTVRIRVTDSRREDVGSGTIIHSKSGGSLILTCAHLFTDFQKQAAIEVDVFHGDGVKRFPATIVGGDHNSDLAVIRIQNAEPLAAVQLTAQPAAVAIDQSLVSFGCDKGATPTPLQTRIVKLKPYLGPANLTCNVPPVQGRSGGGLFDQTGALIGVCSAADPERTEGLYMAHGAIAELIQHLKLQYVLNDTATDSAEPPRGLIATNDTPQPGPPSEASFAANDVSQDSPDKTAEFRTPAAVVPTSDQQSGPEITVVISPESPGGQKRIVVIPRASPWLLELLTGESASN
jgi:thiol-disulfide isomerase/thioredoxin